MITAHLRDYIDRVVDTGKIDADDVRSLQRRVLPDGLASRAEAEALLALERTIPADPRFAGLVTNLVAEFVVWASRPTGKVTAEDARWLAAALDLATPTRTAIGIADAILEEADEVDEALVALVLQARRKCLRSLAA